MLHAVQPSRRHNDIELSSELVSHRSGGGDRGGSRADLLVVVAVIMVVVVWEMVLVVVLVMTADDYSVFPLSFISSLVFFLSFFTA